MVHGRHPYICSQAGETDTLRSIAEAVACSDRPGAWGPGTAIGILPPKTISRYHASLGRPTASVGTRLLSC